MKRKRKSRKIADAIRIIVLLTALSVLLYPTVSNYLYERNSSRVVTEYDDTLEQMTEEERREMLGHIREYNEKLSLQAGVFKDPFSASEEKDEGYENLLNINGTGMMGSVRIPKIDVELPIYHGTSEAVLQAGVGHIPTSSLPVGGESTHVVLTGHRGLPSKKLFTDLDEIKEGDIFYLDVMGEKLAYEVDRILIVLPEETDFLQIEKGKDYVTLVTCTPYGINTHRLLIRGHRIPYEEATQKEPDMVEHNIKIPFEIKLLLVAFAVLLFMWIVFVIVRKKKRKRRNDDEKK